MAKKSYYQRRAEGLLLTISKAKIQNGLTDAELAKKIGMPCGTFRNKKMDPGSFRAEQVWAIEKLAEEVS